MDNTRKLVDAYYDHWARGDFEALGRILTDDFQFRGPMDRAEGPEGFIALIQRNSSMFGSVDFENVHRVIDGPRAVSLYTFVAGPAQVPMAEALRSGAT